MPAVSLLQAPLSYPCRRPRRLPQHVSVCAAGRRKAGVINPRHRREDQIVGTLANGMEAASVRLMERCRRRARTEDQVMVSVKHPCQMRRMHMVTAL